MNSKNLEEALQQAYLKKEENEAINHPKKVRQLASEYFSLHQNKHELEFNLNGHHIIFKKGDLSPESITMNVDNELFSGIKMDKKINELDLVGPEFKEKRNQLSSKKQFNDQLKNFQRISKVELCKKLLNEPAKNANEGDGILLHLLKLLGRVISKSVQSH